MESMMCNFAMLSRSAISCRGRISLTAGLFTVLTSIVPSSYAAGLYDAAFEERYSDFSNRDVLDNFSSTAVRAGQYDQALSTLEQVIFEEPNDIDARISIARIYYHVGSFDLALGHVNEALALAAGTAFEAEVLELQKLINKANNGVRAYLDVTLGGEYDWVRTETLTGTTKHDGATGGVYLDGIVEFDLNTASRDIITLAGGGSYVASLADVDFDADYETFSAGAGYAAITYSKGLPDIIDTLRVDVSAYGEIGEQGNDRIKRELGVRSRISVRPSVETALYADFGYAWLDGSSNLFVDRKYEYGVGIQHRFAPGWSAAAYIGREHTEGYVPAVPFGGDLTYSVESTKVDASLTHLLHVFEDGRSWFQRLSAGYVTGDILDYATVDDFTPLTTSRDAWRINWDHTVQTSTNGQVQFGVGYTYAITGADTVSETESGSWNVRALYTYRFQ